jgi:hypothetical protein
MPKQRVDQKTEHSGEVTHKLYETVSPDDWDEEDE